VVPKYIKTISGLLDQAEYVASANAVDGLAIEQRSEHEGQLRAQMESGDKLAKIGVSMAPDGQPAPLDEDEIVLRMLQYKNKEALRLEGQLEQGNYDANVPQVMRECNKYNAIFGRSCIYNYRTAGQVKPMCIEPWRLFILPSLKEDFSDLQAGAHLEEITLGQLRAEAGDELDARDYVNLASAGKSKTGLGWTDLSAKGSVTDTINSMTVSVIRFGFMSYNIDENGRYWAWYEGTLIVEADLAYGCRMAYNQLYDMENPGAVLPTYIPIIPDQIAGYAVSVADEVMAPADFVQRMWIKMQDELNRSVPKGYAFDLDRIEDVVLANGKKLTKEEVIEMFLRSGSWVHTGVTADGTKDGNIGLRELSNGISPDTITLFQLIQDGIDLIERMTGINSAVSAGNAEKRVAVGALDAAKAGAANALQFLFAAQKSLFERCCRAQAAHYRQQDILKRGVGEGYGAHSFRLMVEQLPTQEEKDKFRETMNAAVEAGAIDFVDIGIIQQVKNPRLGWILLSARTKRKQADAQRQKQQDAQIAMQQQAQTAAENLKQQQMATQMEQEYQLRKQREKEAATTKRAVLLANIKSVADQQIEYYRAVAAMHNTALAGSWQAAVRSLPQPGKDATTGATKAASLNELTAGMMPESATLPAPVQPEPEPEPTPDDIALQQMMGGQPQGDSMAPADAVPEEQMMPA
jgi:hypothetical protein